MITLESVIVVICVIAFCLWAFREPLEPVKEWLLKKYNEYKNRPVYYNQPESGHYMFSDPANSGGFE